jgi:hypothetical protein
MATRLSEPTWKVDAAREDIKRSAALHQILCALEPAKRTCKVQATIRADVEVECGPCGTQAQKIELYQKVLAALGEKLGVILDPDHDGMGFEMAVREEGDQLDVLHLEGYAVENRSTFFARVAFERRELRDGDWHYRGMF